MRQRKRVAALALITFLMPGLLSAAEVWGESLGATTDYLIRGISRSNQHAALQADVHVVSESGFIGGVFASSVQFDSGDRRSTELSGFVGFSPGKPDHGGRVYWRATTGISGTTPVRNTI